MHNKSKIITRTAALILLLSLSAPILAAQTKQNAADIYREAISLHKTDYSFMETVRQVTRGKIDPNQAVIDYVNANQKVIDLTIAASKVQYCNWGDHFSPHDPDYHTLDGVLYLTELVLADIRIRLDSESPQKLLHRCINVYNITTHIGAEGFGFVIGISLQGKASDTLALILANGNIDHKTLQLLKRRLLQHQQSRIPFKETYNSETEYIIDQIEKTKTDTTKIIVDEYLKKEIFYVCLNTMWEPSKGVNWNNCEFVNQGPAYFIEYSKQIRRAIPKPYSQAYLEIEKLEQKALSDSHTKDKSTSKSTVNAGAMNTVMLDSVKIHHSLSTASNTHFNAMLCALDLYIIKARTNSLPVTLPPNSPKDLFSGKDFIYEKNNQGFTLRCRAKDMGRKKTHQWQFKIDR